VLDIHKAERELKNRLISEMKRSEKLQRIFDAGNFTIPASFLTKYRMQQIMTPKKRMFRTRRKKYSARNKLY
jgi:hypothetical protein